MLNSRFPLTQIVLEINEAPEEEKMWDIALLGEKLDRYFGKQLACNAAKQKLVSLFVELCRGEQLLVLEGIEHTDDLSVARSLSVPLGQGFLLGLPTSNFHHSSSDYSP